MPRLGSAKPACLAKALTGPKKGSGTMTQRRSVGLGITVLAAGLLALAAALSAGAEAPAPAGTARRSREHCRLFLERGCRACGAEPQGFFAKVVTPANVEDALDDVIRGKVQVAVVDGVSLECYEQVKSGCFARLKVLTRSAIFPAA